MQGPVSRGCAPSPTSCPPPEFFSSTGRTPVHPAPPAFWPHRGKGERSQASTSGPGAHSPQAVPRHGEPRWRPNIDRHRHDLCATDASWRAICATHRSRRCLPAGALLARWSGATTFFLPIRSERQRELLASEVASLRDGNDMSTHMMDGLLLWFLYWSKSSGVNGGLRVLSALDAQDIKDASIDDDLFVNRAANVLLDRLVFSGGTVLIPVRSGRGWSGVVVRDLQKVLPSVAQAIVDGDAQTVVGRL